MTQTYNAKYDPLVNKTPGTNQDYAPTYWVDTVGMEAKTAGVLKQDIKVDCVVIGSGFTGLSTAYHLMKDFGFNVVVLEANQFAWGCTSRNGGQGQNASGRLSRIQWINKWGLDVAQKLHHEINEGYNLFKSFTEDNDIECNPQGEGHLLIAHNKQALDRISKISEINNKHFNYQTKVISASELKNDYVDEKNAQGALFEPDGIGVHPLKLSYGILNKFAALGGKVYTGSPVISWQEEGGQNIVETPEAKITCKHVAVATGGYTNQSLNPLTAYKYMPILSNSVVTRPLTADEIQACNFKTNLVITDTRLLRFYYRLLPDNRLQMGTRSAITGADATADRHYQLLLDGMANKFPALKGIKIDYSWWGWVDVSHDMMPRIVKPNNNKNIYYAFGYGGNGVSFSTFAGKKMAELVAGKQLDKTLPIYKTPLPSHIFRPFRRLGQRMLYKYYYMQDLY